MVSEATLLGTQKVETKPSMIDLLPFQSICFVTVLNMTCNDLFREYYCESSAAALDTEVI